MTELEFNRVYQLFPLTRRIKITLCNPALIPSDLGRGVGRGIVVVIVVVGSPGPAVKSRPSFSFFLPLLTRASLDLPRVKSYGRTDGQVTQTDAAHLSRFEWSERDPLGRDRGTGGRAGSAKKEREREREREKKTKRGRKRERRGTKGGCRESRETKEDGRSVFGRRGLPVAPGPPAGGGQFAAPFFLIRSFLSPAPPQGPPLPLFFSRCAKLRPRDPSLSFFVRFFLPSFLYFPSDLSPSSSLFLEGALALPRSSKVTQVFVPRAGRFFFPSSARRVIAPRATIAVGIDAVLALGTDQVNFLAKLSCTYRRCNLAIRAGPCRAKLGQICFPRGGGWTLHFRTQRFH